MKPILMRRKLITAYRTVLKDIPTYLLTGAVTVATYFPLAGKMPKNAQVTQRTLAPPQVTDLDPADLC